VDISIHEGWGHRAPRTQIVAIGEAGSIDASLLEKTSASCISPRNRLPVGDHRAGGLPGRDESAWAGRS
jgi:hypothetical protein